MRIEEKGAPHLIKNSDGTWRIEIPADIAFDTDDEKKTFESELGKSMRETIERLKKVTAS